MTTGTLLDTVVYAFRDLFGSQNFALFYAYVWGVILCEGRHTVTAIYLAIQPASRYWSLAKSLSRGRWDETQVVQRLIGLLLEYLPDWVYVYNHTHAIKTGKKPFGLPFFRNPRYRKGNTNQSKFHWGHPFAGLGILGLDGRHQGGPRFRSVSSPLPTVYRAQYPAFFCSRQSDAVSRLVYL